MKTHLEIESKYDIAPGQLVPDLVGVGGVDAVVTQGEQLLTATYFDTSGHRLATAGATLRRRTGGTDDGWHLKLPLADGERLEVHRALGRSARPPVALTVLVRAMVRSEPLEPVATLSSHRTVHHLLDDGGRVLAELVDDSVTGERHDAQARSVTWRELEIELVEGDREALADLDAAVRAGGVRPAGGGSKVARVLDAPAPGHEHRVDVRRRTPVAAVLRAGVRSALAGLVTGDPLLRLDRAGSATHMLRAVQRLRAAAALETQVVPAMADPTVRPELTWLESLVAGLGALDAAGAHVREALAAQPADLVLGPVARRLDRDLGASRRTALALLRDGLDSPRYVDLLESLARLSSRPPAQDPGAGRAKEVLPDLADREIRRAERRLAKLCRGEHDGAGERLLEASRRAVERARYAEALASFGPAAGPGRMASLLEETATLLAELDRSARAQHLLRVMAVRAHLDGENSFTYGLLQGLEQAQGAELLRRLARQRKDVKRLRTS